MRRWHLLPWLPLRRCPSLLVVLLLVLLVVLMVVLLLVVLQVPQVLLVVVVLVGRPQLLLRCPISSSPTGVLFGAHKR